MNDKYDTKENFVYGGYRHLNPVPSEEEIRKFYRDKYYEMIRNGDGNPDHLCRFMGGGEEAENELAWLRNSLYSDISYLSDKYAPGERILDVGCGTGELIAYLDEEGFDVMGTEPSAEATRVANDKGLNVSNNTLEDFAKRNETEIFDAAILLNVLEHVRDPVSTINIVKGKLKQSGMVCIVVPNDFSETQKDIQRALNISDEWWMAVPDHINYFNFKSLRIFLEELGFDVVHVQGDFPIELSLLMGYNYLNNPEVGKKCHKHRVKLEATMSCKLRRKIYKALGDVGIGRACLAVGILK